MHAKGLIFLSKHGIRPRKLRDFRRALTVFSMSEDEVRATNFGKRLRILRHAYDTVPFYRRRFDSLGLVPEDVRDPQDWAKIPFLQRQDIIDNFGELLSTTAPRRYMEPASTGGTTGHPVKLIRDSRTPSDAIKWRNLVWCGLYPGVDEASMSRSRPSHSQLLQAIRWFPSRVLTLDTSRLLPADIARFIREFNAVKPGLLRGYPSAADTVAAFAEDNGLTVSPPTAIWVTSAPITVHQRLRIERVFKAPVFDQYGSCEVHWIAQECQEKAGLHINSDVVYLEIIGESGLPRQDGGEGKVVVTDLENYIFPLIRYMNGDMARLIASPCPCGCPLPLMSAVRGRTVDVIRLPDGGVMTGEYATTLFDAIPEAVHAFQVVQKRDGSIRLRVVPNQSMPGSQHQIEGVRARLQARVGGMVAVALELVSSIETDPVKTRFVVNEMDSGSRHPTAEADDRVSEQIRPQ